MKLSCKGLISIVLGIAAIANIGVINTNTVKNVDIQLSTAGTSSTATDMETSTIGKKTYYMVKTEEQLRSIGKGKYAMSYNYVLDANISLTQEWVAIGDDDNPFTGTFNGNGFIISNLKITNKTAEYIGLFGYVEGGTIYNVTLKNVDINSAGGNGRHIGPVVALCLDGKVYDNVVIK